MTEQRPSRTEIGHHYPNPFGGSLWRTWSIGMTPSEFNAVCNTQQLSCSMAHGPKFQTAVSLKILYFKGPFKVASFEHFSLDWHLNSSNIGHDFFTPKGPSEGDSLYPVWSAAHVSLKILLLPCDLIYLAGSRVLNTFVVKYCLNFKKVQEKAPLRYITSPKVNICHLDLLSPWYISCVWLFNC